MLIYKYPLSQDDNPNLIELPRHAEILSCQVDAKDGSVCLWVKFDHEEKQTEVRKFTVVGTGSLRVLGDNEAYTFIATVQQPPYVWHVFEITVKD